jgi:hypothetical protein
LSAEVDAVSFGGFSIVGDDDDGVSATITKNAIIIV